MIFDKQFYDKANGIEDVVHGIGGEIVTETELNFDIVLIADVIEKFLYLLIGIKKSDVFVELTEFDIGCFGDTSKIT